MRSALLLLAATILGHAQDPYTLLPGNYRLETDNEYVRVSRVRYRPGDRLAVHSHPSIPTVYVYLSDAGRTIFSHEAPGITVERAALKAGGVRFNRNAMPESHSVEYLGDALAEMLRVELKTKPGRKHKDTRMMTEGEFPASQAREDAQVRIVRSTSPPALGTRRSLVINVDERTFTWYDPSKAGSLRNANRSGRFVTVELKD